MGGKNRFSWLIEESNKAQQRNKQTLGQTSPCSVQQVRTIKDNSSAQKDTGIIVAEQKRLAEELYEMEVLMLVQEAYGQPTKSARQGDIDIRESNGNNAQEVVDDTASNKQLDSMQENVSLSALKNKSPENATGSPVTHSLNSNISKQQDANVGSAVVSYKGQKSWADEVEAAESANKRSSTDLGRFQPLQDKVEDDSEEESNEDSEEDDSDEEEMGINKIYWYNEKKLQAHASGMRYKQKFMSLVAFFGDMNLSKAIKATMFEDHLSPRIRGMVTIQRLMTLLDVNDPARIAEKDKLEAQRHKESQAQLRAQEKGKGKKQFVQEQEKP